MSLSFFFFKNRFDSFSEEIEASVYKTDCGYGYLIKLNDELIFKQDIIPGIQNKLCFCSYNDAKKISELVKKKFKKNQSPFVTINEIKENEISLDCILIK